eukprot:gb/GFBE01058060.1/.p1 GENE.gb/GFBE01058060.1/~~gb/GFBE01058060.1/.p1  ORF type:complete len:334 (+),score=66.66 gb/GFBE01058060.1/:1-1002(+)
MGGSSSVVSLKADQPSPTDPSKRSVVSDPIDEPKFSDESFWKHFGQLKREPVALPGYAKLLGVYIAKHEISDRDDGTFLVKDTIGGYYGTEVEVNFEHSYDAETNTWTQATDRDISLAKVPVTLCFRLHSEPQRLIETWCVNPESRNSSLEVAEAIKMSLGFVLHEYYGKSDEDIASISSKTDQPSSDGSGNLVACSCPLDGLVSFDELYDGLQRMVRDGKGAVGMAEFKITEDNGDNFKTTEIVESDAGQTVSYAQHVYDKENGSIASTYFKDETYAEKKNAYITKINKSPLVVELYTLAYASRHADAEVIKAVKDQIESTVKKAVEEPVED